MTQINFPTSFDNDQNLYLVHDALRVILLDDYNPGDTSITAYGDTSIFPPTGIITLTEQCSDIDQRAISFYYTSIFNNIFSGLTLLDGFTDVFKPNTITNITQNVMAQHHNAVKDALIAIQTFVGVQGTTDLKALGPTMEGRTNFITKLVYTPRAWFTASVTNGLIPITVNFSNTSFNLGDGDIAHYWDFGDNTTSTEENPEHTYTTSGKFTVSLTVTNQYGQDFVEFPKMINARIYAPEEANITFTPTSEQIASQGRLITNNTGGDPVFERLGTSPVGPYSIPPTIRSKNNTNISLGIPPGNFSSTLSNAGEELNGMENPIDPIIQYTWSLGDDLVHANSSTTNALYGVGGIYDMVLRVDTNAGAYRISSYKNVIDIIEDKNIWLFNYVDTINVIANEYGILSETFKTADQTLTINSDNSFLNGTNNEAQAKQEFARNNGFALSDGTLSGDSGTASLLWAGGGNAYTTAGFVSQQVNNMNYIGFSDVYSSSLFSTINRPWNWLFFDASGLFYLLFGVDPRFLPNQNPSQQDKTTLNPTNGNISLTPLTSNNYSNNANELMQFPTNAYTNYEPNNGRFAVYRSTWQNQTGYFIRNNNVGTFFQLSSFYMTEGILGDPVQNIVKLPDISGSTKTEGQLVNLANGIYFFNNSGNVSAFNPVSGTWEVGGASAVVFRNLQDTSVSNFDNISNTLLASSDQDTNAYLSYDYSVNAFIKFNTLDLTFVSLGSRPSGTQWIMGMY